MSASLVGSEMCIRDRVEPVDPVGREVDGALRERRGEVLRILLPRGLPDPCLLYTSDAADDM
eukprot:8959872-Alexandrium_andersonii.AAC.1